MHPALINYKKGGIRKMTQKSFISQLREDNLIEYIDKVDLSERDYAIVTEYVKENARQCDLAGKYGLSNCRVHEILCNYIQKVSRYKDMLERNARRQCIQEEVDPLSLPLIKLDVYKCVVPLFRLRVRTIGELVENYPCVEDLKKGYGIGEKKAHAIQEALSKIGIELPEEKTK